MATTVTGHNMFETLCDNYYNYYYNDYYTIAHSCPGNLRQVVTPDMAANTRWLRSMYVYYYNNCNYNNYYYNYYSNHYTDLSREPEASGDS